MWTCRNPGSLTWQWQVREKEAFCSKQILQSSFSAFKGNSDHLEVVVSRSLRFLVFMFGYLGRCYYSIPITLCVFRPENGSSICNIVFFSVFLLIPFLVCDDFLGGMWGCPTLGRPPNSCSSCGSTSSSLPLPHSQVLFSGMLFVLLSPPHFLYSGVHGSVLHLRASSGTSQSGLLKALSYPDCCLRPSPPLKWWREFQISAWSIIIQGDH